MIRFAAPLWRTKIDELLITSRLDATPMQRGRTFDNASCRLAAALEARRGGQPGRQLAIFAARRGFRFISCRHAATPDDADGVAERRDGARRACYRRRFADHFRHCATAQFGDGLISLIFARAGLRARAMPVERRHGDAATTGKHFARLSLLCATFVTRDVLVRVNENKIPEDFSSIGHQAPRVDVSPLVDASAPLPLTSACHVGLPGACHRPAAYSMPRLLRLISGRTQFFTQAQAMLAWGFGRLRRAF